MGFQNILQRLLNSYEKQLIFHTHKSTIDDIHVCVHIATPVLTPPNHSTPTRTRQYYKLVSVSCFSDATFYKFPAETRSMIGCLPSPSPPSPVFACFRLFCMKSVCWDHRVRQLSRVISRKLSNKNQSYNFLRRFVSQRNQSAQHTHTPKLCACCRDRTERNRFPGWPHTHKRPMDVVHTPNVLVVYSFSFVCYNNRPSPFFFCSFRHSLPDVHENLKLRSLGLRVDRCTLTGAVVIVLLAFVVSLLPLLHRAVCFESFPLFIFLLVCLVLLPLFVYSKLCPTTMTTNRLYDLFRCPSCLLLTSCPPHILPLFFFSIRSMQWILPAWLVIPSTGKVCVCVCGNQKQLSTLTTSISSCYTIHRWCCSWSPHANVCHQQDRHNNDDDHRRHYRADIINTFRLPTSFPPTYTPTYMSIRTCSGPNITTISSSYFIHSQEKGEEKEMVGVCALRTSTKNKMLTAHVNCPFPLFKMSFQARKREETHTQTHTHTLEDGMPVNDRHSRLCAVPKPIFT